MSKTRARARRLARRLGSRARKGLMGRRSPGAGGAVVLPLVENAVGALVVPAIDDAAAAGWDGGRGDTGGGGGGVYGGTDTGATAAGPDGKDGIPAGAGVNGRTGCDWIGCDWTGCDWNGDWTGCDWNGDWNGGDWPGGDCTGVGDDGVGT